MFGLNLLCRRRLRRVPEPLSHGLQVMLFWIILSQVNANNVVRRHNRRVARHGVFRCCCCCRKLCALARHQQKGQKSFASAPKFKFITRFCCACLLLHRGQSTMILNAESRHVATEIITVVGRNSFYFEVDIATEPLLSWSIFRSRASQRLMDAL